MRIFSKPADYQLFIDILLAAQKECDIRILAFVLMPNHWHLTLFPRNDGDMRQFMHQVTNAHTRRVHADTHTTGTGPLYQGRYKSFIVENDQHLLTVIKYIERNPVRAKLVKRCEEWKWGSAYTRIQGSMEQRSVLHAPPVALPKRYVSWINEPENKDILDELRRSVLRGAPFGDTAWVDHMIQTHHLLSTVRSQGRPKKSSKT